MIEIMTKDEFQRLMKALKPNATHRTVFDKAEIDEIIRRVEAYEGLVKEHGAYKRKLKETREILRKVTPMIDCVITNTIYDFREEQALEADRG